MMRGSPRIAALMLVACVGLATGSVARGGAAAPRTLVDVGDSLAVGTHPYLAELLRDWELSSAAAVGRRSDEGLEILRRLAPSLPRVVVVSLGTNDNPADIQAFTSTVREVISIAGPDRCVVWATIARPAVGGASYTAFNRILRSEAKRSRNFKIVDWAAMVGRKPSLLRADRVHPGPSGYRTRAQETARAVRLC